MAVDTVVGNVELAADEPFGERRARPVQHLGKRCVPGQPVGLLGPKRQPIGLAPRDTDPLLHWPARRIGRPAGRRTGLRRARRTCVERSHPSRLARPDGRGPAGEQNRPASTCWPRRVLRQHALTCAAVTADPLARWPSCPAWPRPAGGPRGAGPRASAPHQSAGLADDGGRGRAAGGAGIRRCSTGVVSAVGCRSTDGSAGAPDPVLAGALRVAEALEGGATLPGRRMAAGPASGHRPTARTGGGRPGRQRPAWPATSRCRGRPPAGAAGRHRRRRDTGARAGARRGRPRRAADPGSRSASPTAWWPGRSSRLVTIASGLDPHGLGVPEVYWMRQSGDYRAAARGFCVGHTGRPCGVACVERPGLTRRRVRGVVHRAGCVVRACRLTSQQREAGDAPN